MIAELESVKARMELALSLITMDSVLLAISEYEKRKETGALIGCISRDLGFPVPMFAIARAVHDIALRLITVGHVEQSYHKLPFGRDYRISKQGAEFLRNTKVYRRIDICKNGEPYRKEEAGIQTPVEVCQ